jgi:TonB-dependent Receptor Plug Domain
MFQARCRDRTAKLAKMKNLSDRTRFNELSDCASSLDFHLSKAGVSMRVSKFHLDIAAVALLVAAVARGADAPPRNGGSTNDSQAPLAEIVVTAQKRTENVQNVPSAVSVLAGPDLEKFQALQLTDYGAYVAGLQVDSGGSPGQTQIALRGIDANGGGATVGTYIDDTPRFWCICGQQSHTRPPKRFGSLSSATKNGLK